MILFLFISVTLASRAIEINCNACGINLRVYSDCFTIIGPSIIPGSMVLRKYNFSSISNFKWKEGVFLEDKDSDELLSSIDLYRVKNGSRDKYLYVISPDIFYAYKGFGTYRDEVIAYAKKILVPVLRKFWLRHHIGWPEKFDLPIEEFDSTFFRYERK